MANSLEIINNFSASLDGNTYTGKQGAVASGFLDPFELTLSTEVAHVVSGTLSTAAVVTVFDDDDDVPADWLYAYFWTEVAMYIQVIAASTHFIVKTQSKVPFTLSVDSVLGAASTTAITGGTEPTLSDIDSIVLGNYTGGSGKYLAVFFN